MAITHLVTQKLKKKIDDNHTRTEIRSIKQTRTNSRRNCKITVEC